MRDFYDESGQYMARDVTTEIIKYVIEKKYSIFNRHVQFMLYILQVEWLLKKGVPCFKDPIQRWKLGAVVEDVYHVLKVFHTTPISYLPLEWKNDPRFPMCYIPPDFKNTEEMPLRIIIQEIQKEDKEQIHSVVDKISKWDLQQVLQFFRNQPLWRNMKK